MRGKNPHLTQIVVIIGLILLLMYSTQSGGLFMNNNAKVNVKQIDYSSFVKLIKADELKKVTINEGEKSAIAEKDNGELLVTAIPQNYEALSGDIISKNIDLEIKPQEKQSFLSGLFFMFGPILLFIVFYIFMMRRNAASGGAGGNMANFGKSKAKVYTPEDNKIRLDDVAGCDEAKVEVAEIVQFLRNPERFLKIGAKIPKGVIMSGPPGTGKTLLAKAIAGEAGVPFFSLSGSDFVEMFVGVGASRVRDLFEQAKKVSPCIIFIDEIDAVGRKRGTGMSTNDEREQTLMALLTEMDGFDVHTNIIMIAATNRKDVLDPALIRPGRFDREVIVGLPDVSGREKILNVHAKTVKLDTEVSLSKIARGTSGFSGAELANLVNEAALVAARNNDDIITQNHFEKAKDKLLMGYERTSCVMPEKERISTAWHEAGHAVIARFLPNADPLHKVTIIPRGNALGVTMQLPNEDRYGYDKEDLLTIITVLYGGRIAEEMFLGQMGTGASNDIERATNIAKNMVMRYGMSEIGPIHFGDNQGTGFRGDHGGGSMDMSVNSHDKIDTEINKILMEQYKRATEILSERKHEMKLLAEALLEKETLDKDEIDELFGLKEKEEQVDLSLENEENIKVDNVVEPEKKKDFFNLPVWGGHNITSPSLSKNNENI